MSTEDNKETWEDLVKINTELMDKLRSLQDIRFEKDLGPRGSYDRELFEAWYDIHKKEGNLNYEEYVRFESAFKKQWRKDHPTWLDKLLKRLGF